MQSYSWTPSPAASKLIGKQIQKKAIKWILIGMGISYAGAVIIPADHGSVLSREALPFHVLVLLFFAALYWYLGTRKFTPNNCRLEFEPEPCLNVDGWSTTSVEFEIVQQMEKEVLIRLKNSMIEYLAVPNDLLEELNRRVKPSTETPPTAPR